MSTPRPHDARSVLLVLTLFVIMTGTLAAQSASESGHSFGDGKANRPTPFASVDPQLQAIQIQADYSAKFQHGNETVRLLRGNCQIVQGSKRWMAPAAVLWELPDSGSSQKQYQVYLEASSEYSVTAETAARRTHEPLLLIDLESNMGLEHLGPEPTILPGASQDPVYLRASDKRNAESRPIRQAQYTLEVPGQSLPMLPAPQERIRQHVRISPKFLGGHIEAKGEVNEGSVPAEYVITITGGVNIVVDNVPLQIGNGQTVLSLVDLTADRAVIWTDANHVGDQGEFDIDQETPFQVYLEGSIVIRQGGNDIRASHAYYDLKNHRGLSMNTEIRSVLPDLQGTLRLRAAEVRQNSENSFHAKDAFLTTSEFGKPQWRAQASDVYIDKRYFGNENQINPVTGKPEGGMFFATSLNNVIYLGDVPVFAAPYLAGPAEDPHIPIRKLDVGYSGMFGATIESAWDLKTILGTDLPPSVDWQLLADWRSARGPGVGSRGLFELETDLFGMPTRHVGWGELYYTNDHGRDNLGYQRRDLPIFNDNRGMIVFRDRTDIGENTWLQFEAGHVFNDDRNFYEQYFERAWDTQKDLENVIVLNHQVDNLTASLQGSVVSNDFNDQTSWLPKADLTLLGQPLFGSPVIWSQHSSIGYGILNQAAPPPNPAQDPFTPLPYFADVEGAVMQTRHELSIPFAVGPVNFVPYALGEVAHWEENLNGDAMSRVYGKAGIRASVEFAKYMPEVQSRLLGLNGLAHKVTYDLDYSYARADGDLDEIAQYNQFDENAQERFRERLLPVEFGLPALPAQFDPRYYAVRTGAGSTVTAPYHELVGNMHSLWLGMHHRWQTKVGPPEAERIVDWMELDLGATIFPEADRDNFGETFGLVNGRYALHVSPRTTFLANGITDFFSGGQNVWDVGVLHQRGGRGSAYLGYRNVEVGPIDSKLITGSFSYVMSPNLYVMTAAAQFDIAEGIDRGESVTVTRIGENFLLHLGLGYDRSRNNVGVALSLEPKFGNFSNSSVQLNNLLGIR
ncbi:hypothetical protein SH668x_001389 [Planctomicrobium sp. SH668]|uniref:hypothetical protein n=1 Tax=Planctomicrobium sp. SH668 TaxID=3448126 RepID=UPI003F5AE7E2